MNSKLEIQVRAVIRYRERVSIRYREMAYIRYRSLRNFSERGCL